MTLCPQCGYTTRIPESERRQNISLGKRNSLIAQGRPRKTDYNEIIRLKNDGLSNAKIAKHFKCSIGSVQNAVKVWKKMDHKQRGNK